MRLEVLSHPPSAAPPRTPLLFVHGAYVGAWCWEEHFLPWFAARGFPAHAVSLRGHGASSGREELHRYGLADYAEDVARAVALLDAPPVLIGHSMGGFVVQKYLERHTAPAAVLMCAVPPQGLASSAVSMFFGKPRLLIDLNRLMSGQRVALDSLREALFAQPVATDELRRYLRLAQPESHRAIWDMALFNLPRAHDVLAHLPRGRDDLLIVGAEHDLIIPPSLVEMTARTYGTAATIHAGMGHGLMLERDWARPANDLLGWLEKRFT